MNGRVRRSGEFLYLQQPPLSPTMKVYERGSKDPRVSYFSSRTTFSTYGPLTDLSGSAKALQLQFHPIPRPWMNARISPARSRSYSPTTLPFIPPAQPDRRSDRIPERIQPSVRNLIKTTRLWMQFEHARCDERRGSFHVVLVISNLLFRYTPLLLSPNPSSISSPRYVCVFVLRELS